MDYIRAFLFALLLSSLFLNLVLAYKIDSIKEEVIEKCNSLIDSKLNREEVIYELPELKRIDLNAIKK